MSREQILAAIDKLVSGLTGVGRPRKKRVLSAEARQRIAAAQKRRWAKQKKEASAK